MIPSIEKHDANFFPFSMSDFWSASANSLEVMDLMVVNPRKFVYPAGRSFGGREWRMRNPEGTLTLHITASYLVRRWLLY